MNLKKIEQYWIDDSNSKFDTAKVLFKRRKFVDSMFYLHLSIEKMIKGLFVNQMQKESPFGHNLLIIISEITSISVHDEYKQLLGEINNFNITTRYDDYQLSFHKICTKKFAKTYLSKGEEIIKWLKSNLKY